MTSQLLYSVNTYTITYNIYTNTNTFTDIVTNEQPDTSAVTLSALVHTVVGIDSTHSSRD